MTVEESGSPSPKLLEFNFLLVSSGDAALFHQTHQVIGTQDGLSRLTLDWLAFPPIHLVLRDSISILARNKEAVLFDINP